MTTPTTDLDRLDEIPASQAGELNRFVRTTVHVGRIVLEPGLTNPTAKRRVAYDPDRHTPDQAIDTLDVTATPLNPRFQVIERSMFARSPEFDVFRESVHALNLKLRDLDGAFCHIRFVPDRRLGKYTDRNGNERERTALTIVSTFPTAEACEAAAEAFFAERRGGASAVAPEEGATQTPPVASAPDPRGADGWTDAERTERATLIAFLPSFAQGAADRGAVFAKLAPDPRLARYFRPTDADVVAVLDRLGIPDAPGA